MQGVDWGVLIVIAFCLLIGWQHIRTPQMALGDQTEHFLYLADEYGNSLEEGILLPRWSPQSLQGFGAPIPHFYPPAIPYTLAVLRLIITSEPVTALELLYTILTVLMGTAVYALLTRWSTSRAGLIAALLLTTSPYVSLSLAHASGDIASYAGITLFCAQIWAINRLLSKNSPVDLLLVSVCTALGLLTAPFYALAGVACAAILSVLRVQHVGISTVLRGGAALLLGIAIAACYWLPAWMDAQHTAWVQVQQQAETIITPQMLIALHQFLDSDALNHPPQFHLGLPILLLNGIGLMAAIWQRRALQRLLLIAVTLLLLTTFMIASSSGVLFGLLTILLAGLAGYCSDYWLRGKRSAVLLAVSFGVIYWSVAPIYALLPQSSIGYKSTFSAYEQAGYGVATLPDGMNLPVSARVLDFIASDPDPERRFINPQPALTQVRLIEERTGYALLEVATTESAQILYKNSYFAGWSASLNGSALPVTNDPSTGLIAVQLPANSQGLLLLTLEDTFWQKIGWGITLTGLLLVCVVSIRLYRTERLRYYLPVLLNDPEQRLLWIVLGVALVFSVFITPDLLGIEKLPPSRQPVAQPINDTLRLLDVQITETTVNRPDVVTIRLLWSVSNTPAYQIPVRVRLIHSELPAVSIVSSVAHPADLPVNRWLPDLIVTDERRLFIPPDAPPGVYQITIDSYRCMPVCSIMIGDSQFPAEIDRSITLSQQIEIR